jgi:hypothetical protein
MAAKKRRKPIPGESRATKYEYIKHIKNVPCTDCKERYPAYVMQFDHVKGRKGFTIGSQYMNKTMIQIKNEIAKCEVVCANCHAERTHKRRVARFHRKNK